MRIISSVREMQQATDNFRRAGKLIGVVPTMGYLHEGHLSLIHLARRHADVVITTIFVNPTQFAPNEDFTKYPRDIERDTALAESAGTDILFTPSTDEMYPREYRTYVVVEQITKMLEGQFRPTHFRGVTTIVTKLFNITKPHVAVFGQKDAQQVVVIKQMVKDLNFDLEIIVAPIVREQDGLALSSRNVYLSESERKQSIVLSSALRRAEEYVHRGEKTPSRIIGEMKKMITAQPSARVDYISIADPASLEDVSAIPHHGSVLISLAVRFGQTRLIDNMLVYIP
ncbi:MAG: pantoate--beta-alanine ligase [Ignavibacteriae bacterium]|nr:pantoate--beta-alanine ligase [Ignavibacteria bacterium]MBI3364311.1 pantoate--beta-alanine ligase [Ignavibacteriota bacterium]